MAKKSKEKKAKDKKGKGFHEDKDPLLGKAKKHKEVALKNKLKKEPISTEAEIVPSTDDENILTLRYEDSGEISELAEQFENENDVELQLEYDSDEVAIKVPFENADNFIDFMSEQGFEAKPDEDEVISKTQSNRSEMALAVDNVKMAETIGDKDDTGSLIDWASHPNRSDIKGVDD